MGRKGAGRKEKRWLACRACQVTALETPIHSKDGVFFEKNKG